MPDLTIEVLGADGKLLQKIERGACVRFNQTETRVIAIPGSLVKILSASALQQRESLQAQMTAAEGKAERLEQQRQAILAVTQCQLEEDQQIIQDFAQVATDAQPGTETETGRKTRKRGGTPPPTQPE